MGISIILQKVNSYYLYKGFQCHYRVLILELNNFNDSCSIRGLCEFKESDKYLDTKSENKGFIFFKY